MDGIIGIILFALAGFSAFKIKQNRGRGDMNEVMTSIGGGSFITRLKVWFMDIVWVVLFCIGLFGGLNYWNSGDNNETITQTEQTK